MVRRRDKNAVPDIEYVYEEVDPVQAQKWLDGMKVNIRAVKSGKVTEFARAMKGGRWRRNSAVLGVTSDGELLNGMHRMLAVVEADMTVGFDVAYGVPRDYMSTIDVGSARTFADVLKLEGEVDAMKLGAVVKRVMMWKQGYKYRANPNVTPSHSELLLFFGKHRPELLLSNVRGGDALRIGLCNSTSAATAFFLFAETDYDQGTSFMDALIGGEDINKGHPAYVCRQRLLREAAQARQRNKILEGVPRVGPPEQLALMIHAWNFWRRDEPMERISVVYTASGKPGNVPLSNANFPEPV